MVTHQKTFKQTERCATMATEILRVTDLHKTYKTFKKRPGFAGALSGFFNREHTFVEAVKPTSLVINKGEFIGLLGPNGAGKTTILKMLTGLIPPTSGIALAFGQYDTRARNKDYLRRIGMVMGQRNQLHPDLPAMDSFRLAQAIYDISDDRFQKRLRECIDLFEIDKKLEIPVRKLSLGERMKMELILAILHEPELLFLDEPTIGLDFNAAQQIRNFLHETNKRLGITVVLTSHYTKDIEELCERVVVINHGRIIYDGALVGLDERFHGERQVHVVCEEQVAKTVLAWANSQSELRPKINQDGPRSSVQFSAPTKNIALLTQELFDLVPASEIKDLLIEECSLEDIFSQLYSRTSPHT
jgi:ABC-2 type transport system ATP-binding protein